MHSYSIYSHFCWKSNIFSLLFSTNVVEFYYVETIIFTTHKICCTICLLCNSSIFLKGHGHGHTKYQYHTQKRASNSTHRRTHKHILLTSITYSHSISHCMSVIFHSIQWYSLLLIISIFNSAHSNKNWLPLYTSKKDQTRPVKEDHKEKNQVCLLLIHLCFTFTHTKSVSLYVLQCYLDTSFHTHTPFFLIHSHFIQGCITTVCIPQRNIKSAAAE